MNVSVDTPVWIDHLGRVNSRLVTLLDQGMVVVHPYVEGELACGNLRNREEIVALLQALVPAPVVEHEEALRFLDRERLYGRVGGPGILITAELMARRTPGAGPWWPW